MSRIVEDFIVQNFFEPAVLKKIDKNQFGALSKSSRTHACVNKHTTLNWNCQTDGSRSAVGIVLFGIRKDFNQIDHAALVIKLLTFDIPHS